jgi:hypothetical protein
MLMLTISLSGFAQKDASMMQELNALANKLCYYIEKIGSTKSELNYEQREQLVEEEVPKLFLKYPYRNMILLHGKNGKDSVIRAMPRYFDNLLFQSKPKLNSSRSYTLYPEFHVNEEGIEWKRGRTYNDGSVESYALLNITQVYELRIGPDGERSYSKYKEVDKKTIKVIRLEQNGTMKYALGDVIAAERLDTRYR